MLNRNKSDKEYKASYLMKLDMSFNYSKNNVVEIQHGSKRLWGHLKTLGYKNKVKDCSKLDIDVEGEKYYDLKLYLNHSRNIF